MGMFMAGKNVMIPLSLLDSMIEFLDELDLSEYHELRWEYCEILWALKIKKQKLELKGSYSSIISSDYHTIEGGEPVALPSNHNIPDDLDF